VSPISLRGALRRRLPTTTLFLLGSSALLVACGSASTSTSSTPETPTPVFAGGVAASAPAQVTICADLLKLTPADRRFLTPKGMLEYFQYRNEDADVGKYNGGQKMLFWAAALGTLGLLLSGIVMWLPQPIFGQRLREVSYILHDGAFSLFFAMIIGHIYLGTAAEPGTFRSMIRGTVTKSWARLHHPRWYREVIDQARR